MSKLVQLPQVSTGQWKGLQSRKFDSNERKHYQVKDHIWKLADIQIITRGKKHFGATYDKPTHFSFGKRVYRDRGMTTDVSKLEITKSGKTKIEYIPQKKRYKPSKLKLIEPQKTNKNRINAFQYAQMMKDAQKQKEVQSVTDLELWERRTLGRFKGHGQQKDDHSTRLSRKMGALRRKYHPQSQYY